MSDSVRPHRRQPTRLCRPWESPGKNTGVGCHFLLQCMIVKSESEVTQLCPTLSDPMDCSLPGSSVHGIFQARVLEWVAIAFSLLISRLRANWRPVRLTVPPGEYWCPEGDILCFHYSRAGWFSKHGRVPIINSHWDQRVALSPSCQEVCTWKSPGTPVTWRCSDSEGSLPAWVWTAGCQKEHCFKENSVLVYIKALLETYEKICGLRKDQQVTIIRAECVQKSWVLVARAASLQWNTL